MGLLLVLSPSVLVLHFIPAYPFGQVHMYPPSESNEQVPPFSHGLLAHRPSPGVSGSGVGSGVGAADGAVDGSADGSADGAADGAADGEYATSSESSGAADGPADGEYVSSSESSGAPVGVGVGSLGSSESGGVVGNPISQASSDSDKGPTSFSTSPL